MVLKVLLLDLLEDLSTLEETSIRSQPSQASVSEPQGQYTPATAPNKATPLSVSISTPQRLRDLQIVSERLASPRKQKA